jgi:mono/diheme cytochrome c family protein
MSLAKLLLAAAATVIVATVGAAAAEYGDAVIGLAYAEKNCSECHAISGKGKESQTPKAPAFAAVANAPSTTETALFAFLQTPHPNMPNFVLTPEDMRNVVAYILGLKD